MFIGLALKYSTLRKVRTRLIFRYVEKINQSNSYLELCHNKYSGNLHM